MAHRAVKKSLQHRGSQSLQPTSTSAFRTDFLLQTLEFTANACLDIFLCECTIAVQCALSNVLDIEKPGLSVWFCVLIYAHTVCVFKVFKASQSRLQVS